MDTMARVHLRCANISFCFVFVGSLNSLNTKQKRQEKTWQYLDSSQDCSDHANGLEAILERGLDILAAASHISCV